MRDRERVREREMESGRDEEGSTRGGGGEEEEGR